MSSSGASGEQCGNVAGGFFLGWFTVTLGVVITLYCCACIKVTRDAAEEGDSSMANGDAATQDKAPNACAS